MSVLVRYPYSRGLNLFLGKECGLIYQRGSILSQVLHLNRLPNVYTCIYWLGSIMDTLKSGQPPYNGHTFTACLYIFYVYTSEKGNL